MHNVIVRLAGTSGSPAVLVTAHYDSVETTPGVGDNGMSVAAMLETIRALQAGPQLRNDVIFVFNDGEEYGLSGSAAFVEEHPWARDVGLVFDFDGDGPVGAPTLEWMTPGDSWMLRELAQADSGLLATPEDVLAKRSEHNNDLHVFAAAGYPGAHIGRVGGSTYYHNQRDSLENLDPGALQRLGDVMLGAVRHFGNVPLESAATSHEDSVVFTVFGTRMLSYPFNWTAPLAGVAILLALTATFVGWRRRCFNPRGLIGATGSVLGAAMIAAVMAQLAWPAVISTHPESLVFRDADFCSQAWYVGALYMLAVAVGLALWPLLMRRFGEMAIATAGLLGVAAISVVLSQMQPSIAYLVICPALAGGIGLLWLLAIDHARHPWLRLAVLVLMMVPVLGFSADGLYQNLLGGAEGRPALSIALLLLVLALLAPQLAVLEGLGRRLVPLLAFALAAALLIGGAINSRFDAEHPRPTNLLYVLNADTGQAYWASPQPAPDEWTSQFLGEASVRTLEDVLGVGGPTALVTGAAPVVELPAPELVLREEQREGDVRTLRLHLASPRQAWRAYVVPGPGVELLGAALGDGSPVTLQTSSLDVPGSPAEGLDFTFWVRATNRVSFVVIDQTTGLPDILGAAPRPVTIMAAPTPENLRGFTTVVHRVTAFP